MSIGGGGLDMISLSRWAEADRRGAFGCAISARIVFLSAVFAGSRFGGALAFSRGALAFSRGALAFSRGALAFSRGALGIAPAEPGSQGGAPAEPGTHGVLVITLGGHGRREGLAFALDKLGPLDKLGQLAFALGGLAFALGGLAFAGVLVRGGRFSAEALALGGPGIRPATGWRAHKQLSCGFFATARSIADACRGPVQSAPVAAKSAPVAARSAPDI